MSQFLTDSHIINAVPLISRAESRARSKQKASNRLRLRDCRDLYLLVGECRALGADGISWRRLLVERLLEMLDADVVSFVDCRIVGKPGATAAWLQTLSSVGHSSAKLADDTPLLRVVDEINHCGQLSRAVHNFQGTAVMSGTDTLLGATWSRKQSAQCDEMNTESGPCIVGINRSTAANLQLMLVARQAGRSTFSRRAVHLLRALWVELRRFQPGELRTVESSVFMNYPKRMLQVLSCLLAGSTAKETATLLSISVHTVQEHIKRLYRRTSTSNRAELADFFREVAPQLLDTPLDQFPDYAAKPM